MRTVRYTFFLLFLGICAAQLLGTAYSDEGVRQWPPGPHDQFPHSSDGQTETDQGENELEEVAFSRTDGFRPVHLVRNRIAECASWHQTDFTSVLFRPPDHS
jgi:hypothetical protein